jgi:hypothetical protein
MIAEIGKILCPILQIRKLSTREVKELAQSHPNSNQNSNMGWLTPEPIFTASFYL